MFTFLCVSVTPCRLLCVSQPVRTFTTGWKVRLGEEVSDAHSFHAHAARHDVGQLGGGSVDLLSDAGDSQNSRRQAEPDGPDAEDAALGES